MVIEISTLRMEISLEKWGYFSIFLTILLIPSFYFNEATFFHWLNLFLWDKYNCIWWWKYVFIVPIHKMSIFINFIKFGWLFILNDCFGLNRSFGRFLLNNTAILWDLRGIFIISSVSNGDFFCFSRRVFITDVRIISNNNNTWWSTCLLFNL